MSTNGQRRRVRLIHRVALNSAIAAALGGALAAIVAGILAISLIREHAEKIALETTVELAEEIAEEMREVAEGEQESDDEYVRRDAAGKPLLREILRHELDDVRQPNPRAALFLAENDPVGDPRVAKPLPGTCIEYDEDGQATRTCAVAFNGAVLALAVDMQEEHTQKWLWIFALIVGSIAGAIAGGLLSLRSATWTLAPLSELRGRLRQVDSQAPRSAGLQPPMIHEEVEELRLAIVQYVDRLAESLAHAQAFAAQAAHELRTPLTTLAAELDLLAEAPRAADSGEIERIRDRVGRLIVLVQRLLILANPGQNASLSGEAVDVGDVANAVVEALPAEQQARVLLHVAQDVIVRGDFELLRVLVANLVDNAIKFSREKILLGVNGDGHHAYVDVVDQGPGVAPDEQAQVFAPFYRGAKVRAKGPSGHGLGLALIAHIAGIHHGNAEFVPTTVGAHLRVRLPRWLVQSL